MSRPLRKVSVTAVKDEAPYLVEWLAYQRLIGFDEIVIATNDSTDGTQEIVDRLAEQGFCTALHFKKADFDSVPQLAAYGLLQDTPALEKPALMLVSDVDEFLQINVGDGTLDALLQAACDFDQLLVRWRVFGSSGEKEFSAQFVTQRFRQASPTKYRHGKFVFSSGEKIDVAEEADTPPDDIFDRSMSLRWTRTYKTLFHYVPGDKLHIHLPRTSRGKMLQIDGGGRRDPDEGYSHLRFYGSIGYDGSYDLCQMNHYANRAVDEYLMKMVRGSGATAIRGLEHWKMCECNEVELNGMVRWQGALAAEVRHIQKSCNLNALIAGAVQSRAELLQQRLAADTELRELREKMIVRAGARFDNSIGLA